MISGEAKRRRICGIGFSILNQQHGQPVAAVIQMPTNGDYTLIFRMANTTEQPTKSPRHPFTTEFSRQYVNEENRWQ
jgi:hypothetical protein